MAGGGVTPSKRLCCCGDWFVVDKGVSGKGVKPNEIQKALQVRGGGVTPSKRRCGWGELLVESKGVLGDGEGGGGDRGQWRYR